jgi:hypothetical protein
VNAELHTFQEVFENGIPVLRTRLNQAFKDFVNRGGYKVVWEEFEDRIFEVVEGFLLEQIPNLRAHEISQTKTKSTYPDFKICYEGKTYAIDIRSGADDKADPWYDMGRLDTFEENHTGKYQAEYYITVKYSRTEGKEGEIQVKDIYIEPFYKSVGIRPECNGVLYRPYDGKLRPKTWKDFASGMAYWPTLADFMAGLKRSRSHRRMGLIRDWIKDMSPKEKAQLRKLLD